MIEIIVDLILATGCLLLAFLCLAVKDVFKSIILFVCLGLMVTIVWVRLDAWDVAMAEAAIGAGITGALLLIAWQRLEGNN